MFKNHISGARCALFSVCLLLLTSCTPSTAQQGAGTASASAPVSAQNIGKKIALPYTEDYALFEGEPDSDGVKPVGLTDKQGKVILPAIYREISVSEKGIFFVALAEPEVYRVLGADGEQIGGNYSWIECISPEADGNLVDHGATDTEWAPVPPYAAHTEDSADKRSYWLLDENGAAIGDEPYDAMQLRGDGAVDMTRDNMLYSMAPDGTVTVSGGEVVQTHFDGKYQVKIFYPFLHGRYLSLVDRDGKEITPGKYHTTIDVPFIDRYVLYEGNFGYMGGEQAFLYDDKNTLLASNSHLYSFVIEPDGSYIGISTVGSIFAEEHRQSVEADGDPVIMGEDGKPELTGQYFVDKNGKRLSERQNAIEGFDSAADMKETLAKADGYGTELSAVLGDLEKIEDKAVSGKTDPNEKFFLVVTADGSVLKLPFKDVLIK